MILAICPIVMLCLVGGSQVCAQKATRETLLLLPEPKALRTSISVPIEGAVRTVWTPAKQNDLPGGVETYSKESFSRLGFSSETFVERARSAADKRLAKLTPEYVRDEKGEIAYAVYRDESGMMATLLAAPSLGRIFGKIFGDTIWVAMPDRYALYVFPAREEAVAGFVPDLRERFNRATFAASPELFELKNDGSAPKVVGSFGS